MIPGVEQPWLGRFDTSPVVGRSMVGRMLDHWLLVELDFQQIYGVDLAEPGLMRRRTWRWLTIRMLGLLSTEGRVQRVLNPTPEQKKAAAKRNS